MTPDIQAIIAAHVEGDLFVVEDEHGRLREPASECQECGMPWPCDVNEIGRAYAAVEKHWHSDMDRMNRIEDLIHQVTREIEMWPS